MKRATTRTRPIKAEEKIVMPRIDGRQEGRQEDRQEDRQEGRQEGRQGEIPEYHKEDRRETACREGRREVQPDRTGQEVRVAQMGQADQEETRRTRRARQDPTATRADRDGEAMEAPEEPRGETLTEVLAPEKRLKTIRTTRGTVGIPRSEIKRHLSAKNHTYRPIVRVERKL
jgi:hypothetical protein